jgi:hypothetical protein
MSKSICSIEGCDRPENARGLCSTHYGKSEHRPKCSVEGCDDRQSAKGYCPKHYQRWRRTGNPLQAAPWTPRLERLPHGHGLSDEEMRLRHRSRTLIATYGISHQEFVTMTEAQAGRCALCGEKPAGEGRGDKWLHVDHCHSTGRVRGLLCFVCNTTVGATEKLGLERIAQYLAV